MSWIKETARGIEFTVWVQPRSAKNAVAGRHGDRLKLKLTAPPVDGAANKMCVKFLAKCLGVPKSAVEIVSGETSRSKCIRIDGSEDGAGLKAKIQSLMDAK